MLYTWGIERAQEILFKNDRDPRQTNVRTRAECRDADGCMFRQYGTPNNTELVAKRSESKQKKGNLRGGVMKTRSKGFLAESNPEVSD